MRRRLALAALGATVLAAFSHGAAAQSAKPPLKVRFGVLTTASQAAFVVGVEKGIFKKYGFDVTVTPLATGAQANQALAAGQVDWSGGGIEPTVIAWATGLPFKAYAMYAKGGDSYGILVRNEANIRTPADLKDKRVAVPQGTAPAQGLSQVVKKAGLPADAVKRVNATYGNMGQMLVQGAVDAMVGLEPFLTITQETMGDKATLLMRLGKEVQGGGFFHMTDAWTRANPDRVEDVVQALWESQQWVRKNPQEAAKIAAGFLKVDPRYVDAAFKTLTYDPTVDNFTRTSLQNTSAYLHGEGLIPRAPDPAKELAALDKVTAAVKARAPGLLE